PPAVKDETWCRTPVDRFILAELEKAGLKPNAVASNRMLARRASFDLVGLPPTPDEIDAFARASGSLHPFIPSSPHPADEAQNPRDEKRYDKTYDALIEKLLAS